MNDPRQEAALSRMSMRTPDESRMANEGQQNAGGQMRYDDGGKPYFDPAPLSEYPRMMFRKTDVPKYQDWADQLHPGSEEKMVINSFEGLLCDTHIARTADEAETMASEEWEITPRAAHGLDDGIAKVATAKDERIAELERQLAERDAVGIPASPVSGDVELRRGPGRPAKQDAQGA